MSALVLAWTTHSLAKGLSYHCFHISTLRRLHYVVWCRIPIRNNGSVKLGDTVRPAFDSWL